jgi:LysM repeat protein
MVMLNGCAMPRSSRDRDGGMAVYDGVSAAYPGVSYALASAAAEELARRYPPAQTTLGVTSDATDFNRDLRAALRALGVSVVPSSSLQVGYTLDLIKDQVPPTCYLQVRTSEGEAFGLVRDLSAYSASPAPELNPGPSPVPVASSDLVDPVRPEPAPSAAPMAVATTAPRAADSESKPSMTSRGIPVRAKATASRIAKRNKVPLSDFCRWNGVTPDAVLEVGRLVHLRDPGPGAVPAARSVPVVATTAVKAPAPEPVPAKSPGSKAEEFQAGAREAGPAKPVEPAPAPVAKDAKAEEIQTSSEPYPYPPVVEEPRAVPEDFPSPWKIGPGSLHGQVQEWAIRAKYRVIWRASRDLEMESTASFNGSFVDAVRQLFSSLHRSGFPLRVTVFQGNNVLEVAED